MSRKFSNHKSMKNVKVFLGTLAIMGLSMSAVLSQSTYVITGNGTQFTATKNSTTVGMSDLPIQDIINTIKADAAGVACIIQLGDGSILDLGSDTVTRITFDGSGTSTWGKITLIGKATSKITAATIVTEVIKLQNVSIDCNVEITATEKNVRLITNDSTGILTISGGSLKSNYHAVVNYGTLNISGATLEVAGGDGVLAIAIANFGTLNISDGTLIAVSNGSGQCRVIWNLVGGTVTISGGIVSVQNNGHPTIVNHAVVNFAKLNISGGIVSAQNNGHAVSSSGRGLNIIGGKVLAENGYALTTDTATISGGVLFAYGAADTSVILGDYTIFNNAVILAWDEATGTATYEAGANDDILLLPTVATAVWANQEGNGGISYANGTNLGFIPLADVIVEGGTGIETIANNPFRIFPNPAFTQLHVKLDTQETTDYNIYSVVGQIVLQGKIQDNSTINIESLARGMYFLKIAGKTVKFIKE